MNDELERVREIERLTQEYQAQFSFEGYRVVLKELFAHRRDPALTIRPDSITFNQACINTFEGVVYIKLHLNEEKKHLAITEISKDDKNALKWCREKDGKRLSRKISGKEFSTDLYKFMDWSSSNRYKIMGFQFPDQDGTPVYFFNLNVSDEEANIKKERKKRTEEDTGEELQPHLQRPEQISFGYTVDQTNQMMRQTLEGFTSLERKVDE